MTVEVQFFSYFRELAGTHSTKIEMEEGATIEALLKKVFAEIPALEAMNKSMLVAVGVEYQFRNYAMKSGDKVSLFPPVQGG